MAFIRITGSRREKIALLLFAVTAIVGLGTGLPQALAKGNQADLYEELKLFTEVLSVVEHDYVRPVDSKELVEGAVRGLLAALDPHSSYLSPELHRDLEVQTRGEFGGLGIEITVRDGDLVVVTPMEGAPAERAGIRAGDIIVKIEGKFAKELNLAEAIKLLRGPKGSPVTIAVQRKGAQQLVDITVVRDNIVVKSVKNRNFGDGYGYVRITQFMERSTEDLVAALTELKKNSPQKKLAGLIFDLRNNPGGLLNQAVGVADLFLTGGVIVYTDGRVEKQQQKFFAHEPGTEPGYPIIVLVNGGSASASEIVAGALKEHGRALVLGTQTFGKGSVQTVTPLKNGGALTLTTALYYTKSGRSIQALGVTPDVMVDDPIPAEEEFEEEDGNGKDRKRKRRTIREGDLPGAIRNPSRPDGSESADPLREINKTPVIEEKNKPLDVEKAPLEEILGRDLQLARALELLKTFNIFQKPADVAKAAKLNSYS